MSFPIVRHGGSPATLGSVLFPSVSFSGAVEANLIIRLLKKTTCVLLLTAAAQFSTATIQAAMIETVPIGNPGNAADTRYIASGVGSVGNDYRIGKYETTNSQYVEFLKAVAASDPYGLYTSLMSSDARGGIVRGGSDGNYSYAVKQPATGQGQGGSDYAYENKPVVFVDWYDTLRFANWLHNGQGAGDTETGAYTLLGGTAVPSNASSITRNSDARWWLPSEDEWYKAAYFDAASGAYFDYPTGSNIPTDRNPPSADTGNSANFLNGSGSQFYPMTDAGAFALSSSPFGTFDQGGNVKEFTETFVGSAGNPLRAARGGSWRVSIASLKASTEDSHSPTDQIHWLGFRVATNVPEPSGIVLCLSAFMLLLNRARTRS